MHLKSIELYGFKSFANKMVFKFEKGITAIVGPNGSGKSNVADAVRWVLGEQSAKQLRGSKMQDVIFAGTEARKPLGYCQVDLTIDNQDMKIPIAYSEVTVSRRVYRSGESEYSINGTTCRMRDVLELFMDTGIGQEGYSIIGQGQIEKILSNKPEERRALFDEAVGIVKFKKRKENAEKKLDEEKQNLYRINDIITELAYQKDTLTEQATRAKAYLKYKEELKTYEIGGFVMEIKKINVQLGENEAKVKIIEDQIIQVRSNYQLNKSKHNEFLKKIENLESEIDVIRNQSTQLTVQKEKKESEIKLTQEQITHLNSNIKRFEVDISTLKQKKDKIEKAFEAYQEDMASLFETSEKSESNLKEQEMKLKKINDIIQKDEDAVGIIQTNMIERLNEISNIKTKMQRYHTMTENSLSRKESLEARQSILAKSLEALKTTLKDETDLREGYQAEIRKLEEEKTDINASLIGLQEAISGIEIKRNAMVSELQNLKSKHKALNEITDQYEGYNHSIKKVMSQRHLPSYKNKICGVVADILKVEKKYEKAIEIALGGNYQNVITEDEATAKRLIEYLKTQKAGRGTFLPITNIKPKVQKNPTIRMEKGFIGYGDELVEASDKYSDILSFLLGRTIIVEEINDAISMGKKYNNTLRIVTLTGDVVNPGGSLTGGAYKNDNTQFLSRKRDLETLKERIQKMDQQLKETDLTYQNLLKEKSGLDKQLEEILSSIQKVSIELNGKNIQMHQLNSEVAKSDEELKELRIEVDQIVVQEQELNLQLKELEKSLMENEVNKDEAEFTVKQMMEKSLNLKKEKENLLETITNIRLEHASLNEQRQNAKSNLERMKEEISELTDDIQRIESDVHAATIGQKNKVDLLKTYGYEITSFDGRIHDVQNQIQQKNEEKQQLNKEQEQLYLKQEELAENITLLEKEAVRIQNTLSKLETQKEGLMEYMWDEYELTYNHIIEQEQNQLLSMSSIKKSIETLKTQIKDLGDVNVNAITEYKAVDERHQFLSEQKEDLIEAERELRKVIIELEEKMQSQFREQFNAINLKFQQVFKELFGGGKAFLRLSDEEQVLDAGIHINVQPPGKKLQSMMLLSGGERAFTAIALLFAIQSLKPSPFCVLDEIEAALDDANVERFAKYLKKLTINTQFIIITHRRGTMEVSDALYGITMQEKGISTQVSVKLLEDILE
ncbi:chromosome segregation protein SMC [Petrocella sp. FN5]|uniref:chromosome segregation protein SMC n=1 Tax=Petrocella sp. FN5 TaxID=3032002 RepID=UPI0023DBA517|nr:chromosome segregation protein SMC [Petrocella sp. FN5]MDF1616391.1 chromosome segregation protein SMC [Petrocella sp. FN5]